MQFILSEAEYKALTDRPSQKAFDLVLEQAKAAGDAYIQLGGCDREKGGYCDECPLSHKEFACTKYREYSK